MGNIGGLTLLLISAAVLLAAYAGYGAWLCRRWGIDETLPPPSHTLNDGEDFVPAVLPVLAGHHFSSIAGAGPIIGAVSAAAFGWLPVLLWILLGSIFIGGVHDCGTLFVSVRNRGETIGAIAGRLLGTRGKVLFSLFAWFCVLLVIAAFGSITASTFAAYPAAATASILLAGLAALFGLCVYRLGWNFLLMSVAGAAGVLACIWLGSLFPIKASSQVWLALVMAYTVAASVLPVWLLLQPRDYLNSFLLVAMMALAVAGIAVFRPAMSLPAFAGLASADGWWLFPTLFVTVACGAVSGFHSLVASGSSSRQLDNERDARAVGYGSMLMEALLAVIAVIAAGYAASSTQALSQSLAQQGPLAIFSNSVGAFLTSLGFEQETAASFIALAISAFCLTTMDTAVRIGRVIAQALGTRPDGSVRSRLLASSWCPAVATAALAWYLAQGGYQTIWTILGASNQLLAAMSLLAVTLWLRANSLPSTMTAVPMAFMLAVTTSALAETLVRTLMAGGSHLTATLSAMLLALALWLVAEATRKFRPKKG